ncbi:MAG: hypothetical protein ACRCX2_17610 [Paraclostridium sp.]
MTRSILKCLGFLQSIKEICFGDNIEEIVYDRVIYIYDNILVSMF